MTNQPKTFGEAQWRFIQKTRKDIDARGKAYFDGTEWRRICPPGGTFDSKLLCTGSKRKWSVESFNIKPMAVFVPHLMKEGHVPYCPHCKKDRAVDVRRARWINCPKVLYGVHGHRYLDTMLYYCRGCTRHFAGYHKDSIQLSAKLWYGFFNFYLGGGKRGYAVDEELYRFIVEESATTATAAIHRRLKRYAVDQYLADYQQYLSAVAVNKIRVRKKRRTIQNALGAYPISDVNEAALTRKRNDKKTAMEDAKLELQTAKAKAQADIDFEPLIKEKENRNINGADNILPGLGATKLKRLQNAGIHSARQLIATDPVEYYTSRIGHLLEGWIDIAERYYASLEDTVTGFELSVVGAELEYHQAVAALENYLDGREPGDGSAEPPREDTEENSKPPLFSSFNDKKGYNGLVLSKFRVDSIVATVFNHRKGFIESKMQSLSATCLKIDFNYKLAGGIHVWTKQGASFAPFKCLVTIQNEDSQTIFWKGLKMSESISEIQSDLVRLRKRLNANVRAKKAEDERRHRQIPLSEVPLNRLGPEEQSIKVIWVDNYCTVRAIVRRCFPGAVVKLDLFHWIKRWNDLLDNATGPMAGIVRALLHRATQCVEPSEYEAKKMEIAQKKKIPLDQVNHKDVLKACKSIIPQPTLLRSNVEAIYNYMVAKDAETDAKLATRSAEDISPPPQKFLKKLTPKLLKLVQELFKHIDRNCLSDPDLSIVNIFCYNSKTGVTYVARGTNTNERDNWDLAHSILLSSHIGKFNLVHKDVNIALQILATETLLPSLQAFTGQSVLSGFSLKTEMKGRWY